MKMCLKLAYCAFSLSSSKDAIYDEYLLWFFFTIILLKFKPFDELQISLGVARVCVCTSTV